jgi:hypothetical protein
MRRLLLALLCATASGTACTKPGSAPLPSLALPKAPPVVEYRVKETRLFDGAVFVHLEIPPEPTGAKPTVLTLLGDTAPVLACGFNAVTYRVNWDRLHGPAPAPLPTDRPAGKWVLASPSAAVLGERYLRHIGREGGEIVPAILDWLETLPEVDGRSFGMVGVSTNGFATLQAVAADRRITAAVAVAACGEYHIFLRDSSMGMAGKPLALDPAYEEWLRGQEIVRRPESLTHAALLMQNRIGDELIPIACADATASALEKAYARAGAMARFRYERSEEQGHGIDWDERRRAIGWLKRWLSGQ